MKASWLIDYKYDAATGDLAAEIARQGMIVKYACKAPDGDYLKLFDKDDCVVVYGSLDFATHVRKEAPWVPGVYYNRPAYECANYYPAMGDLLLNSEYMLVPFGDLVRQRQFIFDTVGTGGRVFIRPNSGYKLFTGTVLHYDDFADGVANLVGSGVRAGELCVLARARHCTRE